MPTPISWTDETWNAVTGCSRVSDGCRFCYAEALSLRYGWSKKPWTHANAAENVVLHPERLDAPKAWKQPQRVFVNSMSDLWHELVPDEFIELVFSVMTLLPQHTFQILTKRPDRAAAWQGPWTDNIWQGTSVEDRKAVKRIDALRQCQAQPRFLSCEPLLEDLGELNLSGIHWVIAGSESGPGARPMDDAWVRSLRDQCQAAGVAFFFKQRSLLKNGRGWKQEHPLLDGVLWEEYPDVPIARQEGTLRAEQPLLFG